MIAESSIQLPDPGDKPRSGTLTTDVYERLRHEIMTGRLLPDEKLRIEALSQRYGVGSSPLREALNRLVAEGLVTQREQRGFNVSPVSRDELLELTRTRCWVNEIVLRESITHGDQRWEESVVLAFHRLSRTPIRITGNPTYSNPQWVQLHRAFHASLNAACPSRYLVEFSNMLHDCADRYRSLNAVANTGRRDVLDEHRAIFEAAIERKTEIAIELMNQHLITTTRNLLANAEGVLAEKVAAVEKSSTKQARR
ncbi:MAG: GntR family transcriptional regulator [Burkholderiales bacterium]|nr:GntR family transcriptional regulator [Burkholderiales bacterium]